MTGKRGNGRIFQRKGSAFLWCAYYLRGKEYRESTGETDHSKAEKFLKRRLKEVGADQIGAKAFVGPQQERVKISELLNALETDYRLDGKDSPQFKSHIKTVRAHFGEWKAVNVTSDAIDQFIEAQLEKGYKPATVNRSTQLLGQAFNLAVQKKRISAAPYIRHLNESDNVRKGFLGILQFRAVESNLPIYLKDYVRFAYLVGWRKSEIASLRWEDVDGAVVWLRGENSKNGESRSITASGELAALMERCKRARAVKTKSGVILADLIFHHNGAPIVDLRKAWATGTKLAGCPGMLFHDLRRTAVRNMVRAGVSEKVAMTISGHKTRSMFDRYNITDEADKQTALERTEAYRLTAAAEEAKHQPIETTARVQ